RSPSVNSPVSRTTTVRRKWRSKPFSSPVGTGKALVGLHSPPCTAPEVQSRHKIFPPDHGRHHYSLGWTLVSELAEDTSLSPNHSDIVRARSGNAARATAQTLAVRLLSRCGGRDLRRRLRQPTERGREAVRAGSSLQAILRDGTLNRWSRS